MKLATERLKGVQIENLPALELIKRYDTEDVFIYADPPYLHGTRKNYLYKHEMKDADHEKLLNVLVKHPGKILLSGYDNMSDTHQTSRYLLHDFLCQIHHLNRASL